MCVVTIDSESLSKEPFDCIPDHLASAENGIGQVFNLHLFYAMKDKAIGTAVTCARSNRERPQCVISATMISATN